MCFNLWPPAIIIERPVKVAGAKGFVVFIQPDAPETRIEHELWHVRQNWAFLFIGSVLLNATKWGQFRLETAAYGRELHFVKGDFMKVARAYADFLAGPNYRHGRTADQCLKQILYKHNFGGLI